MEIDPNDFDFTTPLLTLLSTLHTSPSSHSRIANETLALQTRFKKVRKIVEEGGLKDVEVSVHEQEEMISVLRKRGEVLRGLVERIGDGSGSGRDDGGDGGEQIQETDKDGDVEMISVADETIINKTTADETTVTTTINGKT